MYGFEFDDAKSRRHQEKYGIDFLDAQGIWNDPDRLEIPARTEDEPRALVIGRLGQRTWSAVITYRDACIRIISVRRARPEEVKLYESQEF